MRRESRADARNLEPGMRARAAPAGSARYLALLFSPGDLRPALTALYAFDAEVRAAAHPRTEHAAAHLKLGWWREEVARIGRGDAVHPIGRALSAAAGPSGIEGTSLAEYLSGCLVAAEHDLAGRPIADASELGAYCHRSGGLLQQLAARFADPAGERRAEIHRFGDSLGRGLRMTELLLTLHSDLRSGRVRLPRDRLHAHQLTPDSFLEARPPVAALELLDALALQAMDLISLAQCEPLARRSRHRSALVLGDLALASLRRLRAARFAPQTGAGAGLGELWRAWRAARRA